MCEEFVKQRKRTERCADRKKSEQEQAESMLSRANKRDQEAPIKTDFNCDRKKIVHFFSGLLLFLVRITSYSKSK